MFVKENEFELHYVRQDLSIQGEKESHIFYTKHSQAHVIVENRFTRWWVKLITNHNFYNNLETKILPTAVQN